MNIIYSGGWDHKSEESIQQSLLVRNFQVFKTASQSGKHIALVTLGKEDGFFDQVIIPDYPHIADIIDRTTSCVLWGNYDVIIILGGVARELFDQLSRLHFDLNKIKSDCIVIGDSAGAYVISSHYFQSPPGKLRGIKIEFFQGFYPDAKMITIGHVNNPVFCNDLLIDKVGSYAKSKGLNMLFLKENELRIQKGVDFYSVNLHKLINWER